MKTVKSVSIAKTLTSQRHPMWIFPATYDVIDEAEFQFLERCGYIVVTFERGVIKEYHTDHLTRVIEFAAQPVAR